MSGTYVRSEYCEAKQWDEYSGPRDVVDWINANGGMARYEPAIQSLYGGNGNDRTARIAIRTQDGWTYAYFGDYVRQGPYTFLVKTGDGMRDYTDIEQFYATEAEKFKNQGWKPA